MMQRRWTDAQFVAAVAAGTNFTDVLRTLGLRAAGGNHRAMKRHAARLGVDTSHFSVERRVRGLRARHDAVRVSATDAFKLRAPISRSALRKLALAHITPRACACCGNEGEWQGKPLTLQLDHANGDPDDHRRENLRWLCPNCHSQTRTFAGRGARRTGA